MVSLQQVKEQTENEMSATRKAEQKHLGSTGTESEVHVVQSKAAFA